MKSKFLYTVVLATAFAACTDDYTDWAAPQQNEPEAAKNITFSAAAGNPVDFATLTDESVVLFTPTVDGEEVKSVAYEILLDNQVLLKSADGKVVADEYEKAVSVIYGRRPVERTLKGAVTAYVNLGNQSVKKFDEVELKATLTAPVIEDAYYLVGGLTGWGNRPKDYKLTNGGGDVYDNPVFSVTVPVEVNAETGDRVDMWFKIAPQSAIDRWEVDPNDLWNGTFVGVAENGSGNLEGKLAVGPNDEVAKSWCIPATVEAKYLKIDVNMLDETYTITLLNDPELYLTGSKYNWGGTWLPLTPVYDTTDTFWKIIYLDKDEEIKFAPQADWVNDFGGQATIDDQAGSGMADSGGNLKIANAGWYLLQVTNGATREVKVLVPDVYLNGNTIGSWDVPEAGKFTVPTTADGEFVSPAFVADDEVRICVKLDGFDWWKTEFIVLDGKIEYRGKGGDQTRVRVTTGQKAYLNFTDGTGVFR